MRKGNIYWSVKLELLGLIFLFLGAIWQATVYGWWEKLIPNDIEYELISETLAAIGNMAEIQSLDNKSEKDLRLKSLSENIDEILSKQTTEFDRKYYVEKGFDLVPVRIGNILLVSGGFLLALGKYLLLRSLSENKIN